MKTFSATLLSVALAAPALNAPVVEAQTKCFYQGSSRNRGQTLKGPEFTCECGDRGNWKNCVRNGSFNNGDFESSYEPSSSSTIEGIAFNNADFETLVAALGAADLYGVLDGRGPFTVFAPTDEAFSKLPKGVLAFLLDNPDRLAEVLKYHVIDGAKVEAKDLKANQQVDSLLGEKLKIAKGCLKSKTVTVPCPPCGGWSVCSCSPTQKTECLESGVGINGDASRVTTADVQADNGVIHIIDRVLVPQSLKSAVADIAKKAGEVTIEDVVLESDQFSTLAGAIESAFLVGVLDGEGPFTVFAPTNRAFSKVPQALLEFLEDNPDVLADVLSYHVVAGANVTASALRDGQEVETFLGDEAVVEKTCYNDDCTNFSIAIDDSYVAAADVFAFNGVIHVIDSVLIPSSLRRTVNDILAKSK